MLDHSLLHNQETSELASLFLKEYSAVKDSTSAGNFFFCLRVLNYFPLAPQSSFSIQVPSGHLEKKLKD
ncbi:hypothetical protein K2173_004662 [Erythroxylum novogranatense]|uniref:Uncharacterized protein n=1 Tax=Erythroxylum novogranatense TaxID=1862640 RepID=A0AAV8T6I6_9ROSI|nr:hypothetical protein K2173_004662 [Erythroxylum novogranatense]